MSRLAPDQASTSLTLLLRTNLERKKKPIEMETNWPIKRVTNSFRSTMMRQAPSDLKFRLQGPVLMMWFEPGSLGVPACSIKTRTSIKTAAGSTTFIPITQTRGHLHRFYTSICRAEAPFKCLTAAQDQNRLNSVPRWSEKVLFSSPFLVNGAVKQAKMPAEGGTFLVQ